MIRVALVDDHELIRRGLREALGESGEIRVVGEAHDYPSMRAMLREVTCDVLMLDLNMPGRSGIEVLGTLADDAAGVRAIVLSQYPEDQYGVRALKHGAMAYLNKSVETDVILAAIRTVAAGRKYVTPQIAQALMDSVGTRDDAPPHERLSERELQTLRLIAGGSKLGEMAAALKLSPKTVSIYRARILEKLSLGSNAEIATYALRHNLIE